MKRILISLFLVTSFAAMANYETNLNKRMIAYERKNTTKIQNIYNEWDKELNRVYKILIQKIIKLEREEPNYYKNYRNALIDAQRGWLKFRDAEVKLIGATYPSDTDRNKIRLEKLVELTRRRTLELVSYYQDLEDK